jgi:serine/threonine protein kinase
MELCAALPPHPNVVRVFHVQTVSPQYILMELCNQGRLFDALHGRKTRHALDVRSLAIDLAHAVAHLHQHRTVHVDIKVSHILTSHRSTPGAPWTPHRALR